MSKRYRIITDNFAGYECQIWRKWWPFWVEMSDNSRGGCTNTWSTLESAELFIKNHHEGKNKYNKKSINVVKYFDL